MKKLSLILIMVLGASIGFAQQEGTNVGDKAKDIVLMGLDGKELKMSDIKGKVVLLDFWASWCGPCRMENPNLVKTYNKYKDLKYKTAKGGFEVYSVSLDKNKEAWQAAIAKDGLVWKWHVSDLKGWQSAAGAMYGVQFIPQNFLIDGEGVIVAKNLRGEELDKALDKLLK